MARSFGEFVVTQNMNRLTGVFPAAMLGATALLGTNAALAQGFTFAPPTGLAAGSTYRLAFVTSGTTTAQSTDINTYNSFVTAQAMLSVTLPSTTWVALGSTSATSAVSNLGSICTGSCLTDPIYTVTGVEVAANQAALFYTGTVSLLSAINITQYGIGQNGYAWTGSDVSGNPLTNLSLGSASTEEGFDPVTSSFYLDGQTSKLSTTSHYMYAVSAEITVPQGGTSVPEPGTAPVLATGLALLAGLGWRRHASKPV